MLRVWGFDASRLKRFQTISNNFKQSQTISNYLKQFQTISKYLKQAQLKQREALYTSPHFFAGNGINILAAEDEELTILQEFTI